MQRFLPSHSDPEILERRLQFERLIFDGTASLVCSPPDRLEHKIDSVLAQICRFWGADQYRLMEVSNADEDFVAGHPWAYHLLVEKGEPVVFSSLAALPADAKPDRAAWENERTQAVMALPLRAGGRVTHVIFFSSGRSGHQWPEKTERERLRIFGNILAQMLVNRQSRESLQRSEQDLTEAERLAGLGSWEWDVREGTHHWSAGFYKIFGLNHRKCPAGYETFLAAVHPDDRQAVHKANVESLSDPGKGYSIEYRVVRPDGAERFVHARAEVVFDSSGRPTRMLGTIHDITERKRAEKELQKALVEIRRLKDQIESENLYLREEMTSKSGLPGIIGVSNPIKYVKYRIQQVARSRTTVLLTGETGTGKGRFARELHQASDRKDSLFVNVNCAGLPPNLIESELFGREKGAFTGSSARQIGRFELADGGTLFLDEIGELSLELQAKLLKVIEEGEFERLGSPHPVKVDVRIIASTNRHLQEEIRNGAFRKDLFYRLNVFPITVPPLRERKEDIPLFVRFFVAKFSGEHSKHIDRIPAGVMTALKNYEWPGNVRELMNVVERAVIVSDGRDLQLAERIESQPAEPKGAESLEKKGLAEVEREHILRMLKKAGWRIEGNQGAARLLGINPSTMRARMRKLGIHRPGSSHNVA